MSPSAALESEVFRLYVAVIVGLLGVAGLALALLGLLGLGLGLGLKRNVGQAWASYRGWLVMVPAVLAVLFLGRVATVVFFTVVAVWGFKEYARATGLYRDWGFTGVVSLGMIAGGIISLVDDPFRDVRGWYGLFMALPVYVIAAILAVPIVRNRVQGQLQGISLSVVGFVYFGWMFGHLAFLANARHAYSYLLYLLLAVELSDVAAYTCGKLFGRHQLVSNISPNKTWEGSLGALAVSMALPWALWSTFPHFTPWDLVLVGLTVGVAGQLGDLSISVIKRDLGVKDMGAVLAGHGGILDRIDSLIYVAPLFFHIVRFRHDL